MKKSIYSCNLCNEVLPVEYLKGLRFQDLHNFVIGDPKLTDGTHVCIRCIDQLKDQLKTFDETTNVQQTGESK